MRVPYHVCAAMHEAAKLLPQSFDTRQARVMMLAIGLQESRFTHRAQVLNNGGKGPARGYWQFERGGGCAGVLAHSASQAHMRRVCGLRGVDATAMALWQGIERDDVLAAVAARLLLYTDPQRLPDVTDAAGAWAYYLRNWRPGKPHRHTWAEAHRVAVATAQKEWG